MGRSGGWTLSSTLAAQTGSFFNATYNGFDVSNTNTTTGRPDRIADGNLPSSERDIRRWFDAGAFRVPGDTTATGDRMSLLGGSETPRQTSSSALALST